MESVLTDMCCFSNRAQQQQNERDGLFHFRSTAVSCFDEPSNHKSTCIQSVIQFPVQVFIFISVLLQMYRWSSCVASESQIFNLYDVRLPHVHTIIVLLINCRCFIVQVVFLGMKKILFFLMYQLNICKDLCRWEFYPCYCSFHSHQQHWLHGGRNVWFP